MHIIIVGAGIAGLITARLAQRAGQKVTLLDPAGPGGRARSLEIGGCPVNLGAHALYRNGQFARILEELGVAYESTSPTDAFELCRGQLRPMLTGPMDLATRAGWSLGIEATLEFVRAYTAIMTGRGGSGEISFAEWVGRLSRPVRERLCALVRLSTYCGHALRLPTLVVFRQLRLASGGVDYVSGGWAELVRGLAAPLRESCSRRKVLSVHPGDKGVRVETDADDFWADRVVLAVPSAIARRLLPGALEQTKRQRLSTLDVVTSPDFVPDFPFVLGVDEPVYFSDHGVSGAGRVLHAVGYTQASRDALEAVIDRAAPGWRAFELGARYMPRITVCEALPGSRTGAVLHDRVAAAGDWTDWAGDDFLADAAARSAVAAAHWALNGAAHGTDIGVAESGAA